MSAVFKSTSEKDPRVEAAISHWAPRFVANGVPLADFQEVTASIARWEDWCAAWSARAAIHADLGNKALAGGHTISAGEHFTRAAVCYHFGKFLFVNDMAQMREAHRRAVECRNKALPYLQPPGERVAIDYEGKKLYGNLRKPATAQPSNAAAKPPIVVMCMGLDSAKEEMDDYENRFLKRGLATLSFDGPGQGEAEYDFAVCPEYERPVKAVFDFLETRTDVDCARAGIWGVSLGGYYAPRAAAFETPHQGLRGALGPVPAIRRFHRPPADERRGLPRALQEREPRGGREGRAALLARRVRQEHHLPDLHRRGNEGPPDAAHAGREARRFGFGPLRALGDRGRQPRRQQPLVPLPRPDRRLDGGAARRREALRGRAGAG